jgi:hypothetical protein
LSNHLVAGVGHREVGLGRNDQPKSLKVCGDGELVFSVAAGQHFVQIHRPAFRSNRPQHEREVLGPDAGGRLHVIQICINDQPAGLAIHFGMACDCGHQFGALEIHGCRPAAVAVVDGVRAAGIDVYPENRGLRVLPVCKIFLGLLFGGITRSGIQRRSLILLGQDNNGVRH